MANNSASCRSTSASLLIKYGDALHIHGEGSKNVPEDWYAVAKEDVDASKCSVIRVEYLVEAKPAGVWSFDGNVYECPIEAIHVHKPVDSRRGPQYAWAELGFRMLGPSTMAKASFSGELPVGDEAFELTSDTDDDGDDSMDGFIVPDSEVEPFTAAESSSEFVRDTRAAVKAWNSWVPTTEREADVKSFIDSIAARAAHMDDDRRLELGKPPMESYTNP